MPTDKRARQKENRDIALAQRAAEERRRRLGRFAILGVVLVVIIVMAIITGGDNGDDKESSNTPAAAPSASPTASFAEAVACDGPQPPAAHPKQYAQPPPLEVKPGVDYSAVIHTSCGDIEMDLDEQHAPKTVANFVFLAKEHFYDGLIWHRVELNAVIQTGDPDGFGAREPNGPGYSIPDELAKDAASADYIYGVVGMANVGAPNTGGSQFFVVTHDPPSQRKPPSDPPEPAGYPPNYTILGHVLPTSYDVIDTISEQRTFGADAPDQAEAVKPVVPVYINSIDIQES